MSRTDSMGICPKCGATGAEGSDQEALRAWNGREKDVGRKRATSDYTGPLSGGIKANLGASDEMKICGGT